MQNESQVLYLGRWVSREHFKAFVYSKEDKKLAKSYDEFASLISSGIWKAEPIKKEEPFKQKILITKSYLDKENKLIEGLMTEESNVVEIEPKKRGRKCRSQHKA